MKIVFLDAFTAVRQDISCQHWYELADEVVIYERTLPEQTIEHAQGAEIIVTNKVIISREIMRQLPSLRYVGVLATGYNVVDVTAAAELGIAVTNIPAYSTDSVAQMVFAHLLNITNNVGAHSAAIHQGAWQTSKDFCFQLTEQQELAHQTMGIVGLGNTGTKVAQLALAFGMNLLVYSSKSQEQLKDMFGSIAPIRKAENINQLFAESDVVSLHCPLTDNTKHIVNRDTLSLMRKNAILINTGRGPLVDEQALADALREHRIYAAAVDVLTEEPPRNSSPLIGLDNCHLTPHIAWATTAARRRLLDIAFNNVRAFLNGEVLNRVEL